MLEQAYMLTTTPESEGIHFVHAESCQVLPEIEMIPLGSFGDCAPAMEKAQGLRDPVNACALCCSDCYIKSDDPDAPEAR